jgi:hypothetical protein
MTTRGSLFVWVSLLVAAWTLVPAAAEEPLSHQTQIGATMSARKVVVQTSTAATNYTSSSFVQVTAALVNVPPGENGYFLATFNAESRCLGEEGSWCSVRIICDGIELLPNSGLDFAFNSPGRSTWKSATIIRRSQLKTGGPHVCAVETLQVDGSEHRLDDWIFVIEYWRRN